MNAPPGLIGGPLTEADYAALEARWITPELAAGAFLRRVASIDGATIVGREGKSGDYAGVVIPYLWPGDNSIRAQRVRRDHPDIEHDHEGKRKEVRKYLGPPGRGNVLYFPPEVAEELLGDAGVPVVMVEGEFKTLALWRLAWHGLGDVAEQPAFLPVGLQGVYAWRGKIGREPGEKAGSFDDVKGPVPDLGRIAWRGRKVVILFDTNVESNASVGEARRALGRELESRGAEVWWFRWPTDLPSTINGIDDFLAQRGPDEAIRLLGKTKKVTRRRKTPTVAGAIEGEDWRKTLLYSDQGLRPLLANAITFLQHHDAIKDMVSWDEFAVRVMALQGSPWNPKSREWEENDDIRLAEWLQRQGCRVTKQVAAEAVAAVSRERTYHPVREYLGGLRWDGTPRIKTWLRDYLGVADCTYAREVGARWLISAVARVMEPGCQADHCLILQGPQGARKSTALRIMAGEWFTDQVGDLANKDSAQQIHGVWIVEFAELEQVLGARAEVAIVKAFITRRVDRFRPPYDRRPADFARQCIFAGTVNLESIFSDETGARRFWPVWCGSIDLAALARDRDQLWAEARALYEQRHVWYLDTPELVALALEEQDLRYEGDPWEPLVWDWIEGAQKAWEGTKKPLAGFTVTNSEILRSAIKKPEASWQRADKYRVGRIMRRRGMEYKRERVFDDEGNPVILPNGLQKREHHYRWPDAALPK